MIPSPGFDESLVSRLINNWDEGYRLDYKHGGSVYHDLVKDSDKQEFVKDLITFANQSSRINKVCWILFGVEDKDKKKRTDVELVPGYEVINIDWNKEGVVIGDIRNHLDKITQIADDWIAPCAPDFLIQYGMFDGKCCIEHYLG